MKAITLIQRYRYTPHLLGIFGIAFIALYILSTFSLVRNTALRAHTEREISRLSSTVGDLEFTYISMKNNLSADSLATAGLETVSKINYVSRNSGATALAIRGNDFR